jgi:hypothetical protein
MEGKRFTEKEFGTEEELEKVVKNNYKTLFGSKTIYLDFKNKVESKTFGSAIPDGLLFDFRDKDNPKFYLVEVELQKHDFKGHILPQITNFFTFFKNPESRLDLIDKVYQIVESDPKLKAEFKEFLGEREIYKFIKETVEKSQNILLIIDGNKPELQEMLKTSADWSKMVKVRILKQYTSDEKTIFIMEEIESAKPVVEKTKKEYAEIYHLKNVEENIKAIYERIKNDMIRLDPEIEVRPRKYHISLHKNKDFAYIEFSKKKRYTLQ